MRTIEVLHVTWVDSSAIGEWTQLGEVSNKLETIHTIGMLIDSTPETLFLALSYDPETESVNAAMHIPRACVKEIRTVWTIQTKV